MLYWACLYSGAWWMGLRTAPIFKPYQLPPSPCVRTAWARAVIVPASIAISTCLFGLTLVAVISRMLIMTLWVSRLSFLFLTTSSVSSSSGLPTSYLLGVFAFGFLLDFCLFIWRRVLFWSVSFSISFLGPPRLHPFMLF